MLAESQRVEAIPVKRTSPLQSDYLEHDEIETLFKSPPRQRALALRDRALFMVHYNTGASAQETCDLRVVDVDLNGPMGQCAFGYAGKATSGEAARSGPKRQNC